MLVFPSMLFSAANQVGMKTPEFGDNDEFDRDEFPHFAVFCAVQLGRPMLNLGEHWDNARVIVEIPDDEIRYVTLQNLIDRGLSWAMHVE